MVIISKEKKCIVCNGNGVLQFRYLKKFDYFRCKNCGHVSTYPLPTKQEIIEHYKKRFKKGNYELLQRFSTSYKQVYENFAEKLVKLVGARNLKQKKLLDIGCFTGEFIDIMQSMGADAYGLELQIAAVKIANKKTPGKVIQGDIMNNRLDNKKFDIITMIGLVEHVTDPTLLIRRCKELLNKNGIVFIQTPNSSSFFAQIMQKYWPPYAPVEHIHLFSKRSLNLLLKDNSFTQIRFEQSWKKLTIGYVFNMLQNFGPEFFRFVKPFSQIYNNQRLQFSLPFYIGEMIVTAKRK